MENKEELQEDQQKKEKKGQRYVPGILNHVCTTYNNIKQDKTWTCVDTYGKPFAAERYRRQPTLL